MVIISRFTDQHANCYVRRAWILLLLQQSRSCSLNFPSFPSSPAAFHTNPALICAYHRTLLDVLAMLSFNILPATLRAAKAQGIMCLHGNQKSCPDPQWFFPHSGNESKEQRSLPRQYFPFCSSRAFCLSVSCFSPHLQHCWFHLSAEQLHASHPGCARDSDVQSKLSSDGAWDSW